MNIFNTFLNSWTPILIGTFLLRNSYKNNIVHIISQNFKIIIKNNKIVL